MDSALHRPPVHLSSLPRTCFLPTAQGSQELPPALLAPPRSPSASSPARHHLCTPAHRPEPPAPDLSSQLRHLPQMWALSTRSTCPTEKARRPPEPHSTRPFPELPRLARAPIHPQVCSPLALPGATSITQSSPGAHGTCSDPRTPLKAVGTRTALAVALSCPHPHPHCCAPHPACPSPGLGKRYSLDILSPSFSVQHLAPLSDLSPTALSLGHSPQHPPRDHTPLQVAWLPRWPWRRPGRTVTPCGCDVLSPRGRPSTRLPFQAQLSPGQWQGAINYLQDT